MSLAKTVNFTGLHKDNACHVFPIKKGMIFVFPDDDAWHYSMAASGEIIRVAGIPPNNIQLLIYMKTDSCHTEELSDEVSFYCIKDSSLRSELQTRKEHRCP
jgi:hypothetical protein